MAKLCRRQWMVTGLVIPVHRAASLNAFCTVRSCRWCRPWRLVAGSRHRLEAGKAYCQPHARRSSGTRPSPPSWTGRRGGRGGRGSRTCGCRVVAAGGGFDLGHGFFRHTRQRAESCPRSVVSSASGWASPPAALPRPLPGRRGGVRHRRPPQLDASPEGRHAHQDPAAPVRFPS